MPRKGRHGMRHRHRHIGHGHHIGGHFGHRHGHLGHHFGHHHGHLGHHFGHHHGHLGHHFEGLGLGHGHRHARSNLGGTSVISPMDLMVINQMSSPTGTSMLNAPAGNYYGILGIPGGTIIAPPTQSLVPAPYTATSSAVVYPPESRYSQNEQYQAVQYGVQNPSPVGFEGIHQQINPAPSLSNATLDYQVAANGQRVEQVWPGHPNGYESKGESYTDHLPQPGGLTLDSMTDVHQAPPLKPRGRGDQGNEDRGCCVIS